MLLTKPVGAPSLKDKTGAIFKVMREWGYDVLLNSVPVYMADKQKDLDLYGIRARHFIFTDESAAECAKVINAYKNALPAAFPIKRIAK
jgi:putative protease